MIKRAFAPPDERLRQLIAREKAMPAALAEARKNLDNPPRVYTEIAIEQMTATATSSRTQSPRLSLRLQTKRCWPSSSRPTMQSLPRSTTTSNG